MRLKRASFFLFLLLALNACRPEPYLQVSPESLSFSENGGTQTVRVAANYAWTANVSGKGFSVSPSSGEGNVSVTVTAAPTDNLDPVTAKLVFYCEGVSVSVELHQEAKSVLLVGDVPEIPAEGGTFEVPVQYNTDFTVEVESEARSWISFGETRAVTDGALVFYIQENDTTDPRTGLVTVRDRGGKVEPIRKTFIQEGKEVIEVEDVPTVVLYDEVLNASNMPADLILPEGASYDERGLCITPSEGVVRLDRYYSLAERSVRYVVRFSDDAVALFCSNYMDFTAYVDMTTRKFGIRLPYGYGTYTNREVDAPFLNPQHDCMVVITRNYNKMSLTLMDLDTGETGRITVTNNADDIQVGLLHDYYCCSLEKGTELLLKRLSVEAAQCDYTLLMYGDSITEPETYYPATEFDQSWVRLVIDHVKGGAAASGRGGSQIGEILLRIKNELPYVKAKYVMVTIGTNGGNTEENLSELVEYILEQGSVPILNNIPCNQSNSQVEVNAQIEKIRQKYGLNGCRFDLPTSLAQDGKEVDISTMREEGDYYVHPNVKGSDLMYLQTLQDVPEIYE